LFCKGFRELLCVNYLLSAVEPLLLDTHIILWYLQGDTRIKPDLNDLIESQKNQVYSSIASLWEISIKIGIGKLSLDRPFEELKSSLAENNIEIISITFDDTILNKDLPRYHKDPFDRILISQAINRSLIIVSQDSIFNQYAVRLLSV
jgi:PIN domain nuclease of toxin-antitoxin system